MIFQTIDNDIDGVINKLGIFKRSYADLVNAFKSGGIKGTLNSLSFGITKTDISNIEKYNSLIESGVSSQTAWYKTMQTSSKAAQDLVVAENGAIVSTETLTNAQKTMTLAAKAGTVALKALSIAGNMILFAAIGEVISVVSEKIDELANAAENCAERVDSLMSNYESALSTANSNADTVEELADKYEELSKGVNNLGENISLTADEYSEYQDICNEIADMFPTLISGYTDEGNAILSLKGNVEELRDACKEAQQEAYNLLITSGEDSDGNDIIDNYQNTVSGYTGFLQSSFGAQTTIDLLKQLNASYEDTNSFKEAVHDIVSLELEDSAAYNSKEFQEMLDSIGFNDYFGTDPHKNAATLRTLDNDTLKEMSTRFAENASTIQTYIQTYQAEIDAVLANTKTLANAYLMTNEVYNSDELNEQAKTAASLIVNSIDTNIANEFEDKTDVGVYVNNIVDILKDNPKVQDALTGLFTLDADDFQPDEAKELIDQYIDYIASVIGEDADKLKIRFGFEDIDELATKYQDAIADAQEKFGTDETQFFEDNSINTEEEIDSWNKIAAAANSAAEAEENYLDQTENEESLVSFAEAWKNLKNTDSDDLKDAASNMLELAESGELTVAAFKKIDGVSDLLEETGLSAADCVQQINNLVSSADQLSSMKTGISSISEILGSKKSGDEIGADTLAGMPDEVKECKKSYENFVEVLGNSNSTMEECQKAANKLATSYVKSNNFLSNLTSSNKDYYESVLSEMGVENAHEVVMQSLINHEEGLKTAKKLVADAGVDVTDKTYDEIAALIQEGDYSDNTQAAIKRLWLEENIFSNNTLDVSDKIDKLRDYANALGQTALVAQAVEQANTAAGKAVKKANGDMSAWKDAWQSTYLKVMKNGILDISTSTTVSPKNDTSSSTSDNSSSSNSSNSSSSSTSSKTEIDWIARKLEVLQNKIDLTESKFENLFSLKDRSKNLTKQIKQLTELLNAQEKAVDKYTQKANSVKLSESLKEKVRNGQISGSLSSLIAKYGEKTANKISKYQSYYDNAQSAKQSVQSTKQSIKEKKDARDQEYIDQAESQIAKLNAKSELVSGSKKNKYLQKSVKWIKQQYDYQIKLAKREKDSVLVAELKAEKEKEILDNKIEQLQNSADEYEATADLYKTKEDNTTSAAQKNKYEQAYIENVKEQYAYLIKIAKKEGDTTEAKRLQAELTSQIADSAKEQFDNIATEFDHQISEITSKASEINVTISYITARGSTVDSSYYLEQASVQAENTAELEAKLVALQENLAEQIESGAIVKGTTDWWDMKDAIDEVTTAIEESIVAEEEFIQSAIDAKYTIMEGAIGAIEAINNESDFYKQLLDANDNLVDNDTGSITSDGEAYIALSSSNMQADLAMIQKYQEELAQLDQDYANGSISYQKWYEKRQEILESQRSVIEGYNDEKDAIKSLIEEALEAQLDVLNELIDTYTEALDAEKDLYDYQKSIQEKTDNINTLQKRYDALLGDDSEEGKSRLQSIAVELQEAKDDLEETEYEKYISDQKDMLSDMQEDFQTFIDQQVNNLSANLDNIVSALIGGDGTSVVSTLTALAESFNIELSNALSTALSNEDTETVAEEAASDYTSGVATDNSTASTATATSTDTSSGRIATSYNVADMSDLASNTVSEGDITNFLGTHGTATATKNVPSNASELQKHLFHLSHKVLNMDTGKGKLYTKEEMQELAKIFSVDSTASDWKNNLLSTMKNAGYSEGGIANVLKRVPDENGDDGWITVQKGEGILTPAQTQALSNMSPYLPLLSDIVQQMQQATPTTSTQGNAVTTGDIALNIELPNVTNGESLISEIQNNAKVRNALQDATIGQLMGTNLNYMRY